MPSSPHLTTLASFNGTDGSSPNGTLFVDAAGDLFGTTELGGTSNDGTIFEIQAGSTLATSLLSFDGSNGVTPSSGLALGSDGDLFGTTSQGGVNGDGTVFRIQPDTAAFATVAAFDGTNGSSPVVGLTADQTGNLFGTTYSGGTDSDGTMFEIAVGSNTVTSIASFGGSDGANPLGGLVLDTAGDLFGTTNNGGTDGLGTVFELKAGSNTITALASFNGLNGAFPRGALISDAAGDLFGTAPAGGANNDGLVFEIKAGSTTITTIASFDGADGANPGAGVILDHAGDLFGTTNSGGTDGLGTVFELKAGSTTITTLINFDGTNGSGPEGPLMADAAGNLFGTTSQGGANGDGSVFEVTGSGFVPDPVCYVAGTLILTPSGEVAVETIRAGDDVVALIGGVQVPRKVTWVGHRRIALDRYPPEADLAPVRFRRSSLATNLPRRDLLVSPPHGMLIDGKLIPAKLLANGMSIIREVGRPSVDYHHIELEQHAAIIAEGVAAESYLDTGNRGFFSNNPGEVALRPAFPKVADRKARDINSCAPFAVSAEIVGPIWERFAKRAEAQGYRLSEFATTSDADLHLLADGKRIDACAARASRYSFVVPAGASVVELASRSVTPRDVVPCLDDPRRIGVAVRSIVVTQRNQRTEYGADHPMLVAGWNIAEYDGQHLWRWTKGSGVIPGNSHGGMLMIEVSLAHTTIYIIDDVPVSAGLEQDRRGRTRRSG